MSTTISTAIGTERQSRVSGYTIRKGFFNNDTPNLPQVVVMLGEANTANQGALSTVKRQITSADQAGKLYGYGSPIYQMARILFPIGSDGIGGIPVLVMPQAAAVGATATVIVWTVTGTATANATHKIIINGRDTLDAKPYSVNIAIGDTPTVIAQKYADAINGVLGSPVAATVALGVLTLTTKWKGLTSANVNATISYGTAGIAGVTYAQTSNTAGSGAADISGALAQFEENWYTTVINPYGVSTLDALENFNGVPDDVTPTGRWVGRLFKPFMAFFGNTDPVAANLVTITNDAARISQVTNVLCPAPGSMGMPWEAAANMVTLFARIMQDNPQLDVSGRSYPDMPVPLSNSIGDMSDYNNRDMLVKNGCSTVVLLDGAYQVQDLVNTYHPAGETPLQYNYPRNLNIDWNVKDGYSILEGIHVKDHVIVKDSQVTNVANVIKPKEWKAVLYDYFDNLALKALISDEDFSKNSVVVQIGTTNSNRFETTFSYKRTGFDRINSTDATAGF